MSETAQVLRGNFAGVDLDELVDWPVVRTWLYWGMFWLIVTPSVGVLISSTFNYPDYIGSGNLELTFGRLRPVHVNGVIFGAFSTLFIGLCYYLVPRLSGVRIIWPQLGIPLAWTWSIATLVGLIGLLFGANDGLEAGEFPLYAKIPIFVVVAAATAQFLITISRRLEPAIYVANWYLIAAFVWTTMNLVLGTVILPYTISGINSAAFHGLYIHYIVGLWLTPAGYVIIYYFLPVAARNPLYAHKLSLVGFWSLALFYPFVGIHHYLYSPIADWAETLAIITSMLLIIPVWTVLVNFFGTMMGRWSEFGRNLPAKFLIMGSLMYLAGCFQGSTEALRQLQQPTHFTDFVISHSHLTVFGTFVVWALGGLVYVWPRVWQRELWSFTLGNWSFWLITVGITTMGLVLTAGGLQQGYQWMNGVEWLDSLVWMKPYWLARTLAGISMDIGMSLLVVNLMLTALTSPAAEARGIRLPTWITARPAPAGGLAQ
ncbi:MAG TPA: cbb3-type cytochrome c oxidase subunit I [Aestuariivirgaceae bacterium]|jgi:cytochrome c oxidase cbb3-type subunit I|nr:cbb3-type cytochrome c oxidase subunit I [Aestuariivirgaceae bacterium]